MTISITRYLVLSVIYTVLSTLAFLLTTGGWIGFLIISPLILIGMGLILISTLIKSWRLRNEYKSVTLPVSGLKVIFLLQLVSLLVNYSDCGDNPGGSILLIRIFSPENWCQYDFLNFIPFLFLSGIYGISVLVFIMVLEGRKK